MRRFNSSQVGITQGSRVLFSDFVDDGPMWTASGPREHRNQVTFDEPFSAPPCVHVSLSMWDTDHRRNHRMEVAAEQISQTGFDLVFRTWDDSRIARVRASWLVIGPLAHEDDWTLD